MEYVLTFQQPAQVYEVQADPIQGPAVLEAWKLYMDAMGAAGVLRGGNKLEALSATSVRIRDGKRQIQDGPFADTKELLGGYVVIEVPSLDDALTWASRSPSSEAGSTEVWPVVARPAQ